MLNPIPQLAGSEPPACHTAEPMPDQRDFCNGCGQRPDDLHPIDAVALLRMLQRRSLVLVRHGQRDPAGADDRQFSVQRCAVESVARSSAALAAADRRLRQLLGEQDQGPPTLRVVAPTEAGPAFSTAGPMVVPDVIERLVRSIAGATTEDWYRRRRGEGLSAAALVWLALHDALHCLEDIELALARPSAASRELGEQGLRAPQVPR